MNIEKCGYAFFRIENSSYTKAYRINKLEMISDGLFSVVHVYDQYVIIEILTESGKK